MKNEHQLGKSGHLRVVEQPTSYHSLRHYSPAPAPPSFVIRLSRRLLLFVVRVLPE